MRLALLAVLALLLAAPAYAQRPSFHIGGDVVAGSYRPSGASASELALGGAGLLSVRTPGAVSAYGAIRPELSATTEGGTGYSRDSEVIYYGSDGLPVEVGGACRSVTTGESAPGACGTGQLHAALSAEAGMRLASASGAALLIGVGVRGGAGQGLFGTVTRQFASPVYGRVEAGTGHVMVGLGFGRL